LGTCTTFEVSSYRQQDKKSSKSNKQDDYYYSLSKVILFPSDVPQQIFTGFFFSFAPHENSPLSSVITHNLLFFPVSLLPLPTILTLFKKKVYRTQL
jgi:hypothetical protein